MEKTITITNEQYDQLVKDSNLLNALEAHGVDNWEGYYDALASIAPEEDNSAN